MSENLAFTERAIAKAQRISIESLFGRVCFDYLFRQGRMAYDFDHRLWWVEHPSQGWQVAVWMIPACETPFRQR